MSSKDILKQYFEKDTGRSFQVYNEVFDEEGDVYIYLAGFQFEAFTLIELSGNGVPRMTVKLPREWAQKLGLMENIAEAVVLDDKLLRKAQELTGVMEKTALLHEALKTLIHVEAGRRLAALGGTMPNLDIKRVRADEGDE